MSVMYRSMYQEQFSSPGRVRRTEPRPTSAHRRNNPQPRADFLFPLTLKSRPQQPPLVVDSRTTLPPIGPLLAPPSVPVSTCTEERGTQLNMPPVRYLPSVIPRATTTANTATAVNTTAATAGNKTARSLSDSVLRGRPHTTLPRQRTLSTASLDYGGCCSCFHRVKPFQSGHYTIHPEFVSEQIY